MKFFTALREYSRKRIEQIEHCDILVGIPCYNNEATIGFVIKTVSEGLSKYFPNFKSLIIISDGGSTDDTREVAREIQVAPFIEKFVTIYRGIPGKGSAMRCVFESANYLQSRVCVVCDADLRSIMPLWIKNLAEPVISKQYDFVSPIYSRYKYDGTITNNIVYPLTRALYGKRIRQPIGGDFGFSKNIAKFYSEQDVWQTDIAKFGIDIWMTTTAITERFKICQTRVGTKIHDAKDPSESLGPMFRQVVMTLFSLMEKYQEKWMKVKNSEDIEIFGSDLNIEPEVFSIDMENLVENYKLGFEHFSPLWKNIVERRNFRYLRDLANRSVESFIMPQELWVKTLYDFAVTFRRWKKDRYKLVETLTPIYYGRVASFIQETKNATNNEAEELIEKQGKLFEDMKPYLIERWRVGE